MTQEKHLTRNQAMMQSISRDFRTDTITAPTDEMLYEMMQASRGDSVYAEDEDTLALEQRVAELAGFEAALFCASGTLSNQLAIKAHLGQGPHSILLDARSHVHNYEAGGVAMHCQAVELAVTPSNGHHLTLEDVEDFIVRGEDIHSAPTKVVALENTLSGMIFPQNEIVRISDAMRAEGVKMHVDGARLWEVVAKSGSSLDKLCRPFDSVSLCMSKGLGATVGSILCGTKDFIRRANWFKKQFGGGIRQSGPLAVSCSYALTNTLPLLPGTHLLATRLATAVADMGGRILLPVESNMVWLDTSPLGFDLATLAERAKAGGLRVGGTRFVIHYQTRPESVEQLIHSIEELKTEFADKAKVDPTEQKRSQLFAAGQYDATQGVPVPRVKRMGVYSNSACSSLAGLTQVFVTTKICPCEDANPADRTATLGRALASAFLLVDMSCLRELAKRSLQTARQRTSPWEATTKSVIRRDFSILPPFPRFAAPIRHASSSSPAQPTLSAPPTPRPPQKHKKNIKRKGERPKAAPEPLLEKAKAPRDLALPTFQFASQNRRRPAGDGKAIALTTAESYDLTELVKTLDALGLRDKAINLEGEAIYLPSWTSSDQETGEVFVFESGAVITWGLELKGAEQFLRSVIRGRPSTKDDTALGWVERGRYEEWETEVLEYKQDNNVPKHSSKMSGDVILLHTGPQINQGSVTADSHDRSLLSRLAISAAMARTTKLGVYEEQFETFAQATAGIPALLETGQGSPVHRKDIIKRFGTLHSFRQKLNLEDENLLDEPEFLWDDLELHAQYESVCEALEFEPRLDVLNQRIEFAFSLQATLMDLHNAETSHRLEWIIIILIAFEIAITLTSATKNYLKEKRLERQQALMEASLEAA